MTSTAAPHRAVPVRGSPRVPPLVLVAHGSRDPRAGERTWALVRRVAALRPGTVVTAAFLDFAGARPLDVLRDLRDAGHDSAVLVPLLFTAAYHGTVDVPDVVVAARDAVPELSVLVAEVLGPAAGSAVTPVDPDEVGSLVARPGLPDARSGSLDAPPGLVDARSGSLDAAPGLLDARPVTRRAGRSAGPDPRLLEALDGRLLESTGANGFDALVLAAAGTRDPAAQSAVHRVAGALGARHGTPAVAAFAAGAQPDPAQAVRQLHAAGARRVAVAAYFLAPGRLYDRARDAAVQAGAVAVSAPLGDAVALAGLVLSRYDAVAWSHRRAA